MARVYVNNYSSALTSAITNSATTIFVNSASGLPTLTGSQYYYLTIGSGGTYEIVKVTARTATTLTVVRAQESTSGVAWSAGTAITMRATAESYVDWTDSTQTMQTSGNLILGGGASPSEFRMLEGSAGGSNYTGFKSPATLAGNVVYTMPSVDGSSGNVLSTNGSGTLSWSAPSLSGTMTGDVDVGGYKIKSSSNGNIILEPNGTGGIILGGNSTQPVELRFMEDSDNGTNYVGFKAASSISANKVWELPAADGSANQVITTNGSGVLQFSSGSLAGVLQYFDSKTASGSSELTFTNIPDCAYMMFVFLDIIPATTATSVYMQTSANNGSSYDSGAGNYAYSLFGESATPGNVPDGSNSTTFIRTTLDIKNSGNTTANGKVFLYNPAGTDYTYIDGETVCRSSAATPLLTRQFFGGCRMSAAAVNAVRFYMSSGNITSGTIIAYKLSKT